MNLITAERAYTGGRAPPDVQGTAARGLCDADVLRTLQSTSDDGLASGDGALPAAVTVAQAAALLACAPPLEVGTVALEPAPQAADDLILASERGSFFGGADAASDADEACRGIFGCGNSDEDDTDGAVPRAHPDASPPAMVGAPTTATGSPPTRRSFACIREGGGEPSGREALRLARRSLGARSALLRAAEGSTSGRLSDLDGSEAGESAGAAATAPDGSSTSATSVARSVVAAFSSWSVDEAAGRRGAAQQLDPPTGTSMLLTLMFTTKRHGHARRRMR